MVMTCSKYFSVIYLKNLYKTTETPVTAGGVPTEFRPQILPNTYQDNYHNNNNLCDRYREF
jgi:hypothetical protein